MTGARARQGRMPARRLSMLLGLVALLVPQRARAEEWPIVVTPLGGRVRVVEGATVGSIAVRIANPTSRAAGGELHVEVPAGWRLVSSDPTFSVPGGASELRVVAIGVPASALAGRYVVRFAAVRNADRLSSGSDSVVVQVPARRRLELALVDVPRAVSAGETYSATFLLRNDGNVSTTVALSVAGSHGLSARPDSARRTLAPGASSLVHIAASAPTSGAGLPRHRLDVSARCLDDSASSASYSVVEVLPPPRAAAPAWHTVPGTFVFGSTTAPGRPSAMSAELRAAGAFVEGGDTRFDVAVRKPRAGGLSGERDFYSVGIHSPRGALRLGDLRVDRSPLLAPRGTTFGGSGSITLANATVGGYLLRDRFALGARAVADRGGFVDLRLGKRGSVGADYLTRSGVDSAAAATMHAVLGVLPRTRVEAEYGRRVQAGRPGEASMVRLTSSLSRLSYDLRQRRRAGWLGDTRDRHSRDDYGSVSTRLWRKLSLKGEYQDEASRRDSTVNDTRAHRSIMGGVAYGDHLFAEYRTVRRAGRYVANAFDNEQASVLIGAQARVGRFSFAPRVERGTLMDHLADVERPFSRYRLQSSVDGGRLGSASVYAERTQGGTVYAPQSSGENFGIDASTAIRRDSRLHVAWNANRYDAPSIPSSSALDASLEQRLPGGHQLTLRVRLATYGTAVPVRDHRVQMTYSVPFGIPTARAMREGGVEGRVIDAESGRPMGKVVVRLADQAAMTGSDGRYRFVGLSRRVYHPRVDGESLSPGQTQLSDELVDLSAHGGYSVVPDIRVARSARLVGEVSVFDFMNTLSPTETPPMARMRGLAGALIALRQGQDTLRVLTDSAGRFVLNGIRPGEWHVSLWGAALPDQHYAERDTLTIMLVAGATDSLAFRVLPRRRTIQMVTSGEQIILLPGASEATATAASTATPARTAWPSARRVVPPPARARAIVRREVPPPREARASVRRVVPPPSVRRVVPPPVVRRAVPPPVAPRPSVRRVVPPPAPIVRRIVPPPARGVRKVVPPPSDSEPTLEKPAVTAPR